MMQGSTDIWPVRWFRGTLAGILIKERRGQKDLRRQVEQLRSNYEAAKHMLLGAVENNKRLSETILQTETENVRLTELVKKWEDANKRIDPNQQCPVCGDRNGHLETLAAVDPSTRAVINVVCRHICHTCGNKFVAEDAVMGADIARKAYQQDLHPVTIVPPAPERK